MHGIVITARCDAEQDKVRIYNYLPVVPLDDWLARDGKVVLAERLLADTLGRMKNELRESGFSPSILETENPESILKVLFFGGDKKTDKAHVRFEQLCVNYGIAISGLTSKPSHAVCMQLASAAPYSKDTVIRDLVHQRLAGYYFFDQIEPGGDDRGHVALLREIRLMPRRVAFGIMDGINEKQFEELSASEPRSQTSLAVKSDDLAMPVGIISSPNLEHLMQTFAMMFGRIGLPDPDPSYVSALWERQRGLMENSR